MTCANSVLPTFIPHSKFAKPGMIANAQSEIQIVDTHESLGTLIDIDVAAGTSQFNRTLVMVGFDQDGDVIDEKYETAVLARNKSPLYASLDWLIENAVIDENDLQSFEQLKATRNSLAHELPSLVISGADFKHVERFQDLVALLRKIEVWWIVNLEIPVNSDFDGNEDIDKEGIVPGPVLMLQMMLEVLSGNEELLKHYRESGRAK